jgi:hypothetical protein
VKKIGLYLRLFVKRATGGKDERTKHHFYAEIVTEFTTRNSEHKDTYKTTQTTKKISNTDPQTKPGGEL